MHEGASTFLPFSFCPRFKFVTAGSPDSWTACQTLGRAEIPEWIRTTSCTSGPIPTAFQPFQIIVIYWVLLDPFTVLAGWALITLDRCLERNIVRGSFPSPKVAAQGIEFPPPDWISAVDLSFDRKHCISQSASEYKYWRLSFHCAWSCSELEVRYMIYWVDNPFHSINWSYAVMASCNALLLLLEVLHCIHDLLQQWKIVLKCWVLGEW